jgi:transmembrane sensor
MGNFTPDPAVEAAAADWLVQHDRGLTATQQDAFLQWLSASPAHRESFERHRRMWRNFDSLAQWRHEHGAEPNPDLLAPARPRRVMRWLAPVLLAAAAVVLVAGAWWLRPHADTTTLSFEATEYRQETLADGSVIDLNRGAQLVVQFSAAERRVLLLQGEAQFSVAKNPARPFVVRAGGVDVRAVGTAFNVKLAGANLEVLVTEGTVHLSQPPASPHAAAEPPPVLAALSVGQRTVIAVAPAIAPPAVVPVSAPEIDRLLDWRPRLLDFESTPLAEAVEIFNRANPVRLVIADEELRTVPIVASIRSNNLEGFVRMLEATVGVRAERRSGEIVLRRAR